MKFDISKVIKEMGNAAFTIIKNEVPIKQKEIQTIFNEHKKELEEIAEKIIKGLITDSDAKYLLRQKERLVKIKLLGLNIKSKITAEKAVNASIDIFNKAIKKSINTIL